MSPTKKLMAEHEAIELMLDVLDKMSNKFDSGKIVDANDPENIVDFIKIFADKCHHGKEENLLFPALEKTGIPKESGPIGVMLSDHQEGRGYVRKMAEAVAGIKEGNKKEVKNFAKNARNYIQLLRGHIEKENNILYPLADDRLTPKQQEELKNGFTQVERKIIGEGKHEEYHRLLDTLKKKYLT